MSELLPCPFCGKKVYIGLYGGEPDYFWMVHGGMHYDECKCRLFMESCKFELEDESKVDYDEYAMKVRGGLVRRWNSRAERTCEFNIKDNMNETEGMGDVWIECSACHCVFDFYADEWLMKMSYCPNCGAKVVG